MYANDQVASIFYLDIFGVSMSRVFDSYNLPLFWLGVDDDDLSNGLIIHGTFTDTYPSLDSYKLENMVTPNTALPNYTFLPYDYFSVLSVTLN